MISLKCIMDLTLCVSTYLSDSVLAMIAGRSPDLPTLYPVEIKLCWPNPRESGQICLVVFRITSVLRQGQR